MVEIGFVQTIIVAGLTAFALFIVAMPVGAKVGRKAGKRILLGSLVVLLVVLAVSLALASGNGDLDAFKAQVGPDGLLQIGAFMLMVLFTTYFFASRYLDDLKR